MTEEQFWAIINLFDWTKTENFSQIIEPAVATLSNLPIEQIQQFEDILSEKLWQLDTLEHANASLPGYGEADYLSADGFLYARCLVVANGQKFFQEVIENPSEFPVEEELEALLYVASDAYKRKIGNEFEYSPKFNYETGSNLKGWPQASDD